MLFIIIIIIIIIVSEAEPPSVINGGPVSVYIYYIHVYLSIHQFGPMGAIRNAQTYQLIEVQYNDVNVQNANVTGSMKLHNTKPLV